MLTLIGSYIISIAIIIFIVLMFGWDLEVKDKIAMIIGGSFLLAMIYLGAWLVTGGK